MNELDAAWNKLIADMKQLRAELAEARAEVERLRSQWEKLLVEIEDLTSELPEGKDTLDDVVAAVKLMCDQRDAAGDTCGTYWAEVERLRQALENIIDANTRGRTRGEMSGIAGRALEAK